VATGRNRSRPFHADLQPVDTKKQIGIRYSDFGEISAINADLLARRELSWPMGAASGGVLVEAVTVLANMTMAAVMNGEAKISSVHRDRLAVFYLRQSSMAQIREHTEFTTRQYGLVDKAVRLGWALWGSKSRPVPLTWAVGAPGPAEHDRGPCRCVCFTWSSSSF
jgi:hypothetical protein